MLIDFTQIDESVTQSFYGGEKELSSHMFTDNLGNRILRGKLEPGASIGYHKHENGSEIIYVLHGSGKALYDDGQETLTAGLCHYCPKGHSHSLINNGGEDLVFFAVVAAQ